MSNKLKAAIIGLGWAGCEHLKGYVENPQSEVFAVCDMDEDRARQIAKENNAQLRKGNAQRKGKGLEESAKLQKQTPPGWEREV